jgi:hypothetical protein
LQSLVHVLVHGAGFGRGERSDVGGCEPPELHEQGPRFQALAAGAGY